MIKTIKNILILLVVTIICLLFTKIANDKISNDKIYDTYYEHFIEYVNVRTIDTNDSINIAIEYINNKEYYEATNILKKIINHNNNNIVAHFYLGILYQETKNYNAAIEEYEFIIKNNNNIFIEQSEWYAGLCYMKLNKNIESTKKFENLLGSDYYKSKVQDILNIKHNIIINAIFLILILSLVFLVYYKQLRFEKSSTVLIEFLTKNIEFLTDMYIKNECEKIKKTIQLYSQMQVISNVAKCDYISFFKYNYNKRYLGLDFMFTINNGKILEDIILYDLGNNILTLESLKFNSDDIYYFYLDDIKNKNVDIYKDMSHNDLNKIYYHNIYNNTKNPIGFIAMSYQDKNYELPEDDKNEILRMMKKIKYYI